MNINVFIAAMIGTGFIIFVIYVMALSDRGYRYRSNWYVATLFNVIILLAGFAFSAAASTQQQAQER
jgi:hypothetical protein